MRDVACEKDGAQRDDTVSSHHRRRWSPGLETQVSGFFLRVRHGAPAPRSAGTGRHASRPFTNPHAVLRSRFVLRNRLDVLTRL